MLLSHELATFSLLITINHIQNCGTKYWNPIFALFINFLLWSSGCNSIVIVIFLKAKKIYSFINQILQLKKNFIHSLGAEQMHSFSLRLWPFTLKFPALDRWCIPKSWHEWCYIVKVMRIYIYIYILFLITMLIHISQVSIFSFY